MRDKILLSSSEMSSRFATEGSYMLPVISVVVPIYNEQALIHRLHQEVAAALDPLGMEWEVIYVDDGSEDRSRDLLLDLQKSDPRLVLVELSRNWGHQAALSGGLNIAKGDAVILMDGDLQDPPVVIQEMVTEWHRGSQIVIAQRRSRQEIGYRKFMMPLFYRFLGLLSDTPIPLHAGIFGLLDRKAVDAINQMGETNRYIPGLRAWMGFRTGVVFYDRAERAAGCSKQTFVKLTRYALNAIFSFSYKPIRLSLVTGLMVAVFALVYGSGLLMCRLLGVGMFGIPVVNGYTSTIVSILFLGGVQLISVGILGEYIGRVYDEVKRRPLFLIQKIHKAGSRP